MGSLKDVFGGLIILACSALALSGCASLEANSSGNRWVGTWAAAQQPPKTADALDPAELTDATLRQIVHVSLGGNRLRIRLSNALGVEPLVLNAVHVALATSAAAAETDEKTDRKVTFNGQEDVIIPTGGDYFSDPVLLPFAAGSNLAVTMHFASSQPQLTIHRSSLETTYLLHGEPVSDADFANAKTVEHWFNLSGIDVEQAAPAAAIVTLGDSITDGTRSTRNGNDRWPDILAQRLRAAGKTLGVLNAGIGGNRLLLDDFGPNALARFDRDVLEQTNVGYVIILEGVNDLGVATRENRLSSPAAHETMVRNIKAAYAQMVSRARVHGIKAIGATILPYAAAGYRPNAFTEADRLSINDWIKTPGNFDGFVDFDAVVRDPAAPNLLLPAYDSGDHIHPSPAGYKAMGDAIALSLF